MAMSYVVSSKVRQAHTHAIENSRNEKRGPLEIVVSTDAFSVDHSDPSPLWKYGAKISEHLVSRESMMLALSMGNWVL